MPREEREGRRGGRDEEPKREPAKVRVDVVNEVVMLAAVATDERARRRYLSSTPPDYFLGQGHAEMWTGLRELDRRGLDYSIDALQTIVGQELAVELDAYVRDRPTAPKNLNHHADGLRWGKARADTARGPLADFYEAIQDPTVPRERVQLILKQMSALLEGGDLRYLRGVDSVMAELDIDLTRRRGAGTYPFGVRDLDFYGPDDFREREGKSVCVDGEPRMLPGTAPGLITVLTGESGSGKTTLSASMALSFARSKRKLLWGAWEQLSRMSLELVAAIITGMSRSDLIAGAYGTEDQRELMEACEELKPWLMFFELPFGRDSGVRSKYRGEVNEQNLDLIHQYVAGSGCDVFVADVFRDLMEEMRPDDEIRAIKRLRGIAVETHCHCIAVQHINLKTAEARGNERPTRGNVMGSGDWINKADNVLATHKGEKLEVHVLKQRYGPWPQAVEFDWDPEFGEIKGGRTLRLQQKGAEHSEVDAYLDAGGRSDRTVNRRRRRP